MKSSIYRSLGFLFCFAAGWLFANHFTHHSPIWWAIPPFVAGVCFAILAIKEGK